MPKTPSGKQPSLFSFFKKTPKQEGKGTQQSDVLTPKKSPNSKNQKRSPEANGKSSIKENEPSQEWKVGDLVWSKLEGYPWWPSLVCNHPTQNTHRKAGKAPQIHVQFFEEISRAWIKEKYVKLFKGSTDESFQKGGAYYSLNHKIRQAATEADKALELPHEERLKLVVELQPSSEEEEEDEDDVVEEKMDFDPSIFDAEMSDEEKNHTTANEDSKSPSDKKENASPDKPTHQIVPKRKAAKIAEMKSKRRKVIKSESGDEESEDDFKPGKDDVDDDEYESESSGEDEDEVSDVSGSEPDDSPVKMKRKAPPPKPEGSSVKKLALSDKKPLVASPTVSANTKSKLSLFSAPDTPNEEQRDADNLNFTHLKLDFLQPEKIRDKMRKPKTDPDYNPRTLFVPESFLTNQTPAMRQWWVLKSEHFDTVLFFKVGKFYELYHMDAATGVTELGLIYMKGDWAHSGFPEIAYTRYADALIQKGYKVARVEQTETPDMVQERCRNMGRSASKFDKVVKREVCQVNSQGVRISSNLERDVGDASNYILAVCEKEGSQEGCCVFGVCFIDTSIGTFHIGQFEDDRHMSRFRTLIAHYTPSQVLYERGKISAKTLQVINVSLVSAIKEALSSGTEFWESGKTLQRLAEEDYFKDDGDDKSGSSKSDWPPVLTQMLSDNDSLGLTASDSSTLAIRALGALTWYLQYCLIDHEMLSMKKFEEYKPLDNVARPQERTVVDDSFDRKQRYMVLDGVTMANLDIVKNSQTGTTEGSLLERLNLCTTAFGKRLFHQWLCAPLCQPTQINDRLDAVDDLLGSRSQVDDCVALMKKLPDLERLLGRIHTIGMCNRGSNHPDSRAIMYEEVTYSKRKIEDFLSTIDGFRTAVRIIKKFASVRESYKSKVLRRCVTVEGGEEGKDGHFPDIAEDLDFFDQAFDHKRAKRDGIIVPSKGVDEDHDEAVSDFESIQRKLDDYLQAQKKLLNCSSIVYWGTGKNRFQMEITEQVAKKVPDSYELMSSKKGAKRFRTSKIEDLLAQLTDAEERKDASLKDIMRRIFHSFDERYSKWIRVVECLSVLDVLVSLSTYSRSSEMTLCRPEIVFPAAGADPTLEIREGRHPCVSRTFEGGDFIPNDTLVGVTDDQDLEDGDYSKGQMVLVTGPNMGGKSTLMRQVGLIVVMAQMGCYVPADKCRLTPIDRIFTRLGASDNIMAGESTFFVELSETSSILQHATRHSLVLLDELGRGTATYDGTAIASSVVKELSDKIGCRTLFSTHYHSLVEDYKLDKNIQLGHMACMVENDNEGDPSQETITFLYKFVKGACPKSYGFNAARLAGIVEEVIQSAVKKSKQFEEDVENRKHFRGLWRCSSDDHLSSVMSQLKAVPS